ncbi:hypothetical protein B296_00012711 [Ensete ventricosum]|uniref:Uncharacterized protein n=1 Tax=Ensete ventricosum TaxID=4639 RepID=A0A426YH57_ENSVE|nr:hypothetical protein B296_00012711 [Ensete ventricosum]
MPSPSQAIPTIAVTRASTIHPTVNQISLPLPPAQQERQPRRKQERVAAVRAMIGEDGGSVGYRRLIGRRPRAQKSEHSPAMMVLELLRVWSSKVVAPLLVLHRERAGAGGSGALLLLLLLFLLFLFLFLLADDGCSEYGKKLQHGGRCNDDDNDGK